MFNILFASLPIMVYAVWDQEYPDDVLTLNEKKNYYEQGIKSNRSIFLAGFHFF